MQTIIVDMTPGFRMPTIYYSQGDVGTQFAIDLRSRFGDSFPTGTTVTIQATKPSGFGFSVAATSVTNGVATFTTTAEMTDEFGRFPAELKVTKTGLTLFTANFYMDGERNTHPEGTTDGSQETVIPELTQLVERVEDAASSVLDMTVVANTLPAGSDATYSYDEETNTATFGIPKGADGSLASGVLAPTYSSSSTYAVGDYVYYSGSLYRCTTAITTAEAWTSGHWTQVALAPEVSDLKSDLKATIGFERITTTVFTPDATPHSYATKREFYPEAIPSNVHIKNVSIPIANQGGGSILNVEIWELGNDNTTLTRVKVVNATPVSNTTNVIPVNYFTQRKCYIAFYFYNVQIFNTPASGKYFYYDSVNNVDATTLSLSTLSTTSNYVPTGGYEYDVPTTALDNAYRLPVKWRQGTMSNGNPYFTLYGCVTDFMIPTAICDKIKVLANTHTMSVNYYDYSSGALNFISRVAFTADYNIDKTHDYFVVNLFKSWSEQTLISQCDNIVGLYVTLPYTDFTKSVISSAYHANPLFNIRDIWSMAHQGYSSDGANHNKKGGYARAAMRGFTHGECDVKLTSDGVPVCCHDDTFTDATSSEVVTIANKTYDELITYDYYGGTIASLEEIITECKQCGLHLEIDHMSSTNVSEVTAIVSKLSAWDICIFAVNYMNEYPDLAPFIANAIKQENSNARFLVGFNGFSNYENAVAFAKSLGNATFAVGSYTNANLNTLKTIASLLSGEARLHIWTVDDMGAIKNALPFINGWTSNAISGDDIFNPTKGSGLNL